MGRPDLPDPAHHEEYPCKRGVSHSSALIGRAEWMSCKTLGRSPPPSVRVSSGFTITAGMKEMFGMSLIARPWQKVCLFVILVYGISAPFEYLAIQSGSMGGGGGLYALGGMWSPAVAAMIMKLLFRKETAPFGKLFFCVGLR